MKLIDNFIKSRLLRYKLAFFLTVVILMAWIAVFIFLTHSPDWTLVFSQLHISLWAIFTVGVFFIGLSQWTFAWQIPDKSNSSYLSKWLIHLLAMGLPLLLFWLLYHQVLNAWWSFDDPHTLHYVDSIGPWAGFFEADKKYGLSYVPLQPLSAAVDWQLFGLNPSGFYWHHLLSVSAVILLAYAVLNLFFAPLLASMIVSLFVVCVPTAQVVHYLMVRHYIEGLALALIAVWFYIKAVKQEQWTWAILGSVFYLLSTLAKELYIPLVMVLAFLPVSTVKRRIRFLRAYVFAAIIYTLLRLKMQGEYVLSSYEQTTTWQDILSFPTTFFNIMGFHAVWQWLPVVGIGIILGIALLKKPLSLGLSSFMWFSMVFAPLIPILWRIPHLYYYLFVFALLFFIGCGIALNELGKMLALSVWRTFIITSLFLCLLLANFLPGQQEQLRLQKHNQTEKIQGEFLMLSHSPSTVLIYDYHVAGSLIYLRDKVLGHTEGVKWCPRKECFCAIRYPNFMAKQYLNGQWQTHQLSTADCDDKKNQQNLSVKLTLKSPSMITWELGPYSQEQGNYEVSISLDEYGQLLSSPMIFKVPPQGEYNFLGQSLQDPLTVRVKYRSAQGWEIFSPPLILEAKQLNDKGIVEIVWQRFEQRKTD